VQARRDDREQRLLAPGELAARLERLADRVEALLYVEPGDGPRADGARADGAARGLEDRRDGERRVLLAGGVEQEEQAHAHSVAARSAAAAAPIELDSVPIRYPRLEPARPDPL